MASALSQQICCPVCLYDVRDPVSLPCEHFFCRECITRHSTMSTDESTCPVCRWPYTSDDIKGSRLLRNIVEATRAHLMEHEELRTRAMNGGPAEDVTQNNQPNLLCPIHREPFKLFCETDNKLICVICRDEGIHQGHYCKSLKDALQDRKKKTSESLAVLLAEDKKLVDLVEKQTAEFVKTTNKSKLLSDQISVQFEMMHNFLKQKEDEVMKLLDEKQNEILEMMANNMSFMEEILSDTRLKQGVLMSAVENEQPCQYLQWWTEYGQALTGKTLSAQPHYMETSAKNVTILPDSLFLGPYETHLQFFTWKEMLRSIQPVPHHHKVTDEGNHSIKVSTSRLSIHSRKQLLMRNKGSSPWLRTDSSFGTGQHYWEVEVGQKAEWGVGVFSYSSGEDTVLCLSSDSGYYIQQASYADRKKIDITPPPRKIGVYLDCERRQVSFYNADSMTLIDTLVLSTLPHSLCLSPGPYLNGKNTDPLTMCWY